MYRTGHGSRWLAELTDDLKVGLLDIDKIFADPSLPATLRYAGKSVNCHTLQEAVLALMRLQDDHRDEATIRAIRAAFCARAINGKAAAAAPPKSMINSRRLIRSPRRHAAEWTSEWSRPGFSQF
jgi:hypothetical protein